MLNNINKNFSIKEVYKQTSDKIILNIKVVPKSRKNELVGIEGNKLKVRINAEPEKDKANEELIRFFSDLLKIPRSQISLHVGQKSRCKQLLIHQTLDIEKILTSLLTAF
jgi:uncharacterized protein (TIGR00251 family)